jgi:FtsP/CotA-like multicopper oxidase with cupredoxin domain
MRAAWRIAIVVAVAVVAGALFLLLRPDGGDAGGDAGGGTASFEIAYSSADPEIATLEAREGQRVRITVTLDFASEVHLHGYDLADETGPGAPPAEFDFVADTPGRFSLEAHTGWRTVARLVVEP